MPARNTVDPLVHTDGVKVMQLSPSGKLLASASGQGIFIWDMLTCRILHTLLETGADLSEVQVLTFSTCGHKVAAGAGMRISIWDLLGETSADPTAEGTTPYYTPFYTVWGSNTILALAFSPDNSILVSCAYGPLYTPHQLSLWDINAGLEAKASKEGKRDDLHTHIDTPTLVDRRFRKVLRSQLAFPEAGTVVLWTLTETTDPLPTATLVWKRSLQGEKETWDLQSQHEHPMTDFRNDSSGIVLAHGLLFLRPTLTGQATAFFSNSNVTMRLALRREQDIVIADETGRVSFLHIQQPGEAQETSSTQTQLDSQDIRLEPSGESSTSAPPEPRLNNESRDGDVPTDAALSQNGEPTKERNHTLVLNGKIDTQRTTSLHEGGFRLK